MALKNFKTQSFEEIRNIFLQNTIKEKLDLLPFEEKESHWRDECGVPRYHPGYIKDIFCQSVRDSLNLKTFVCNHPELHLIEFELEGVQIHAAPRSKCSAELMASLIQLMTLEIRNNFYFPEKLEFNSKY